MFSSTSLSEKRENYLKWDEYFMAMTLLECRRNKRNEPSEAAIILNENKIIISVANASRTAGYNHAEHKSLQKINKNGKVMYSTSFPCLQCAQTIIEAGIEEVVYYYDSGTCTEAKNMFDEHGVIYRQFLSEKQEVVIDFNQFGDNSE